MQDLIKEIISLKLGKVLINEELKNYTTYRVGGKARAIVYPSSIDNLTKLITLLNEREIKYFTLGKGSNVLFSDNIYNGIIIKLDNFNKVAYEDNKIICGAGTSLMKIARDSVKHNLQGLEFADGIPGTIGGAVFMNAGCYGEDMSMIVESAKVLTNEGKIITLTNKDLKFSYRTSILQKHLNYVILEATLKLRERSEEELEKLVLERRLKRKNSQPLEYPSAGSVFRNPEGYYAGKLIEDMGLKGYKVGKAEISTKHANFIINTGNAKASDIKSIIDFVKIKAIKKYNIRLRVEQRLINWDD